MRRALSQRAIELRPAARPTRIEREAKLFVTEQRPAVARQRCDHGQLGGGQLTAELVFFNDGRVVPATGTVELGDQHRAVAEAGAVDAVFVAVQGQQVAVARHPPGHV